MAKDKTRERSLPEWLKQRTAPAVRVNAATAAYYQLDAKVVSWHDSYGNFRQGARVGQ